MKYNFKELLIIGCLYMVLFMMAFIIYVAIPLLAIYGLCKLIGWL